MTITPFETNLYQHLTPFFTGHDYALLAEKKQYRRMSDTGFQNIILSSVFYGDDTALDVNFGCRNNQVEQIAQQFLNSAIDYRPEANTVIISIGRFNGYQYFRFKVHTESELNNVCNQIEQFFNNTGFDFLTSACSIPVLDQLLNNQPNQPSPYVYNQTHRCYKGLIAARLNHNPHFDGLIDAYRYQLIRSTQNPYEQLHFERLITYLQHYSAN